MTNTIEKLAEIATEMQTGRKTQTKEDKEIIAAFIRVRRKPTEQNEIRFFQVVNRVKADREARRLRYEVNKLF